VTELLAVSCSGAYEWLVDFHRQQPHLIKALLAGTLVSTVCGVIGCFIILRRMAFLGDAIAHAMLAGVVVGYLLMKLVFGVAVSAVGMLVGSIIAGFVTVTLISFVSKVSRIKEDTSIGIMYTGIFAAGGLLVSLFDQYIHIDLYHFVVGSVLAVSNAELWMMALVAAFVFAVVILLFRPLQLTSFDPIMAASIGIPVVVLDYLLTACTSLVVVSGVNIVGVILVVGLLVTPAATAYLLCDRLSRMLSAAAFFGFSSFMLGYAAASKLGVSPGPTVVVAGTLQFLFVLVVAPRYGLIADWLRKTTSVPQEMVEDVLGAILRSEDKPAKVAEVIALVDGRTDRIQRAIRSLERQDLLELENGCVTLTAAGTHEARRLVRAHRLWETYLQHVGLPEEKLHEKAHHLEHMHDEETVDYLDDKLGHPIHDPHGSVIPEDFVHLVPGEEVRVSLLRKGHSATITDVEIQADNTLLEPGMTVTVGPRLEEQNLWRLILPDGEEVMLDHNQADAVTVKLHVPEDA
jgi:ABC-type Mn2+/Zn2+ transport system permease subunit/Mn-dependent DtxR family transcriptional regulator